MRQDVSAEVVASRRHAENYIHAVKYINLLLNVEGSNFPFYCAACRAAYDENVSAMGVGGGATPHGVTSEPYLHLVNLYS